MKRCVFAPAAAFACSLFLASNVLAQTAKPTPATPAGSTAPAAPAKFVPLVKGVATIQYIQSPSKRVGSDIVTVFKVKNTSVGAIGLLRLDEMWYDHSRKQVSGDTQTVKRVLPGEVVEITLKSPAKPDLYQSQYMFSHVNGKVDPKKVTAFK
jgi:hypothetical protein